LLFRLQSYVRKFLFKAGLKAGLEKNHGATSWPLKYNVNDAV